MEECPLRKQVAQKSKTLLETKSQAKKIASPMMQPISRALAMLGLEEE